MRRPFGLRRKIFWSLVGSMLIAGLFTWILTLVWTGWTAPAIAFVAIVSLWHASGRLAYRLVRPLNRLLDVVQRIGAGELSARANVQPYQRDEISSVARAVDDMAARIEHQLREERQLLAVVSHELRTPLARIRVLTDLAREGQTLAVDEIDREVADIDYLVANILARSRLEFGTLTRKPVHLPEAATEALARAGITSAAVITGEGVHDPVSADPTLLHRAIANLIDNAQRHGRGVDRVEVRATPTGIAVEVFDRGAGFSQPGDRFQAFTPESGGSRGSGLGLGLNLVQRIIHSHNGRVWAENRSEGGARVGFELPRDSAGS